MNDPSNIALFSKLVRFQVDFSRTEFLYNSPDNVHQRTLQSLAHSLGLEYEYCLRARQARITRPDIPLSDQVKISGFSLDHQSVTQDATVGITASRPGINENGLHTECREPVVIMTNNLETFDPLDLLDFGNDDFNLAEFDSNFNFGERQADGQERASSQLLEKPTIPMDISNGPEFFEPWDIFGSSQFSADFAPIVPHDDHLGRDPNPIQRSQDPSCVDQFLEFGEKDDRGSSSKETYLGNISMPAIHDHQSYSALSFLKRGYEQPFDSFSEASIYHSQPAYSRSGSISGSRVGSSGSSVGSVNSSRSYFRGRPSRVLTLTSRRPSTHSRTGSRRFREIVFDSSQSRPTSTTSTSSVCRKPLDSIGRAAAKAVKAIGACWRCKFLRKQCDTTTPCEACPKATQHSNWRSLGCKRGSVKSEMIPIPLCPRSHAGYSMSSEPSVDEKVDTLLASANGRLQEDIRRRAEQTVADDESTTPTGEADVDPFIKRLNKQWPSLSPGQSRMISSFDHPFPAKLLPLDQCILDILWEALDCPLSHIIIGSTGDLIMLRAAAMYQAKTETDQLIAQSLICLRTSLEALRVANSGYLEENLHQACDLLMCKVDCIANITSSLDLYTHELSRVFFKKENMRNKSWWLSVFYSFCIQSMVKKALIMLIGGAEPTTQPTLGAILHLHLAVRLFIASSGSYDPLIRNYSIDPEPQVEEEVVSMKDFELAQYASYTEQWPHFGIKSTKEFLEQLFKL